MAVEAVEAQVLLALMGQLLLVVQAAQERHLQLLELPQLMLAAAAVAVKMVAVVLVVLEAAVLEHLTIPTAEMELHLQAVEAVLVAVLLALQKAATAALAS